MINKSKRMVGILSMGELAIRLGDLLSSALKAFSSSSLRTHEATRSADIPAGRSEARRSAS